jgi:hypothetical protein
MNLRELFEARRALPNENSNGKPIAYNDTALANFWAWFKGSKVVDEHKRPMVMYHGTNADFARFSYDHASVGAAEYGTGFYFTNFPSTASGYANPASDTPNVIPVYLSIKNPMKGESKKLLTGSQISQFVEKAPNLNDILQNEWGIDTSDTSAPAKRELSQAKMEIINGFKNYGDTLLRQLNLISNDLYKDQDEAFLQNSIEITKHDGLVFKHQSGEYFYVAWNASQIASAVGASGSYSGTDLINEYIKDDK